MKTLLLVVTILFGNLLTLNAQSLNEFQWKARPIILFTPDQNDPLFEEQLRLLYTQHDAFQERNVIFILAAPEGSYENTGRFVDEATSQGYYERFNPQQFEFTMVLVGLDGHEKFRAANRLVPASVLLEMIDDMPMRRQETMRGSNNKSQNGDRQRKTTKTTSTTRRKY